MKTHKNAIACAWIAGAVLVIAGASGGMSGCGSSGEDIKLGASGTGKGSSGDGGAGGAGGAGGVFIDDAGPKGCPETLDTPTMIAVPGWNGVSFCIDSTEVTNTQYAIWLESAPDVNAQATACASNLTYEPSTGPPPKDDRPVSFVDWCDAFAFCKAAGKRLCGRIGGGPAPYHAHDDPARNQWFNACSHGGNQAFPYGAVYNPDACNVSDAKYGAPLPVRTLPGCEGGFPGIFDMSGNVWEWEDACVPPDGGGVDVCRRRGGAYPTAEKTVDCDTSSSRPRDNAEANTGFRCCAD